MSDPTYQSKVHRKQGGDELYVANGGKITVEAGGVLTLPGAEFDGDGNFRLTNTVWDDLRFPAVGIDPPGAVSDPSRDTTDGRLVFSASAVNTIAIQAQLPHAWKEGSAIRPHLHWSAEDANAGNVVWEMKYKIASVGEAFPALWTTLTVTDAADGADIHQIVGFAEIAMTGKTLSAMMLILISRLGNAVADTYAGTAKLNEFDIHYEIDSLGSDDEFIK